MKQSPIKNMAYWKAKNTISPVKQEVKKKVALEPVAEVIKTGPKPDPSKRVQRPDVFTPGPTENKRESRVRIPMDDARYLPGSGRQEKVDDFIENKLTVKAFKK